MKTTSFKNHWSALLAALALPAGFASGQTALPAPSGVNLQSTGNITNGPAVTIANSISATPISPAFSWEGSNQLQGFVLPVSNFTGRTTTGASVNYEDLLPLKATKVQVMKGAAGAAPTGIGTLIDSIGIDTDSLIADTLRVTGGSPGVGKVLTSDAVGNATWQTIAAGSGSQTLSLSGGTLSISNGNSVTLPDISATNEIQALSLSGGTISLSNGGGSVTLPDISATNEIQALSLTGSTLSLSNGGGSVNISSLNTDAQNLSLSGTTLNISGGTGVNLSSAGFLTTADGFYTANGTLNSARTVTMGGNSLTFSGGAGADVIMNANRLMISGTRQIAFNPETANDPNVGTISQSGNALFINGWGTVGNRLVQVTDDLSVTRNILIAGNNSIRFDPDSANDPNVGTIRLDAATNSLAINGWGAVGGRLVRVFDDLAVNRDILIAGNNAVRFDPSNSGDPNVGIIRLDAPTGSLAVSGWGALGNRKVQMYDDVQVNRSMIIDGPGGFDGTFNGTNPRDYALLKFAGDLSGEAIGSVRFGGVNDLRFYTSYQARMTISNGGRVGIGTTNPRAALHVESTSADDVAAPFTAIKYIDNGGANANWNYLPTWGIGANSISIYAQGMIVTQSALVCSAGITWSDERFKTVLRRSDSEKDLSTLQKLSVTDYVMKDRPAHGNRVQKKIIAQELEKVLPDAVSQSTQFVPDIYQQGFAKKGVIKVNGADKVKAGDKIRVFLEENGHEKSVELTVSSANKDSFTVQSEKTIEGKVFVYGVERNDVRGVDYDAISMLNVSATQELARRNEQLTAQVKAQAIKLANQEAEIAKLNKSQRVEIASLKKQQAAEIAQIKAALEAMNKLVAAKVTEKATKVVSTTVR